MKLSLPQFVLFALGLLVLVGSAALIFRLNSASPEHAAENAETTARPDVPKPPPLQLNGLEFSVDRERFLVQAKSVATGETVWESTGMDRFIIPGDAFPLDISPEGNLWVGNVGRKRLEQLDPQTGRFLASWAPQEAFLGCCNPVRFAALRNGHFVTVEKGVRQARVFDPAGNVVRVITSELSSSEFNYQLVHVPDCVYIIDKQLNRVWTVPDPEAPEQ